MSMPDFTTYAPLGRVRLFREAVGYPMDTLTLASESIIFQSVHLNDHLFDYVCCKNSKNERSRGLTIIDFFG